MANNHTFHKDEILALNISTSACQLWCINHRCKFIKLKYMDDDVYFDYVDNNEINTLPLDIALDFFKEWLETIR